MERPPYISYSAFEDLATQQRRDFNDWNQSTTIALDALQYLEFLVNEQGLLGWGFENLNRNKKNTESQVLGTYNVFDNVIIVDESLKDQIARMTFTIIHESEHFRKHRKLFIEDIENYSLFSNKQTSEQDTEFVCYREDIEWNPLGNGYRKQIEWQANYGAACLLLPLKEIREDIAQQATLHEIANKYGVSYQATKIRIEQIKKAFDNVMTTTNLPLPL